MRESLHGLCDNSLRCFDCVEIGHKRQAYTHRERASRALMDPRLSPDLRAGRGVGAAPASTPGPDSTPYKLLMRLMLMWPRLL